jgi:hypothetical protein
MKKKHLLQYKTEAAKTFETYCCNICVKTYICNIQIKMIATYVWKQIKHFEQTLATCF